MIEFILTGVMWALIFAVVLKWNPKGIKEKLVGWLSK
jgi:hypothetical protein